MKENTNKPTGLTRTSYRPGSWVANNIALWKTYFWKAWEPLPLDAKLAWLVFVSQTIAVITAIELLFLKR